MRPDACSLRAETACSILGSCKSCDIMRIMHLLSHERCWSTTPHNLPRQRHPQLRKHVSPAKRQDFKTVRFLSSLFAYIIHPCHQPIQATHKQSAVVRASFGNGWPPKIPDAWPHPLLVWARAGSQTTIPNNSKHPKTQAMRRTPSSPERLGEWPDKSQISAYQSNLLAARKNSMLGLKKRKPEGLLLHADARAGNLSRQIQTTLAAAIAQNPPTP